MAFLTEAANRGSISTGFDIDNSLKLEADNNEHLYVTTMTSGNRRTWTYSIWFKRTELGFTNVLIHFGVNNLATRMMLDDTDELWIDICDTGSTNYRSKTNRLFRDTSAWYHVVLRVDTTQSTEADRMKLYVNGVEETSWKQHQIPTQNLDTLANTTVGAYDAMGIGTYVWAGGSYDGQFSGYIAQVAHVDGQSYAPTEFGEFDSATGIWKPKDVSNLTYGTSNNSFLLDFSNSADLGNDSSGNNNDWSLSNVTAVDQATDTPTNNFATFNVAQPRASGTTITKGGTDFYINSNYQTAVSSIAVSSGKWYAEFSPDSTTSFIGIVDVEDAYVPQNHTGYYLGYAGSNQNRSVGLRVSDGALFNRTGGFWGAAASANNILGIALDMDNRKVNFSVNGTWMSSDNSGNASAGATWNTTSSLGDDWTDVITMGVTGYSNIHWKCNFGGYTDISISSANTDADGYGSFEYAPPTGFYALCSKNLAEYGG